MMHWFIVLQENGLNHQLINIRNQLDDVSQQLEVSIEREKAARADCEQQASEARQVCLHIAETKVIAN